MNQIKIGKFIAQRIKEKNLLYGIMMIVMEIALQAISHTIGGTNIKDFCSGLILGISIGVMLIGVYVIGRCIGKKN